MNIELLNKCKVIEWTQNYWKDVKLLNEFIVIE